MKAVHLVEATGPGGLSLVDVDEPVDPALVVIDLHTAGVSFPDLLQTTGSYQTVRELPCALGFEGAGTVRSAPPGSGFTPGRRVAVLTAGEGAWQQTVAVAPSNVFALPDAVSLSAGSGFLLNYLTAHFALDERARYCRRDRPDSRRGRWIGYGRVACRVSARSGDRRCREYRREGENRRGVRGNARRVGRRVEGTRPRDYEWARCRHHSRSGRW